MGIFKKCSVKEKPRPEILCKLTIMKKIVRKTVEK